MLIEELPCIYCYLMTFNRKIPRQKRNINVAEKQTQHTCIPSIKRERNNNNNNHRNQNDQYVTVILS